MLALRTLAARPIAGHGRRAVLFEFALLAVMAAFVHALVLRFIFPGFYSPLWPNHSDFYIAPEFAHSARGLLAVFARPRPLGYLFFYLTGALGTRGAIACTLVLVLSNAAVTAMFVRRIGGLEKSPAFFCAALVYLFLIFVHPLQYVWSTYDVFSQVSYLLLALGLIASWRAAPPVVQIAVFAAAFLAKETFVLSAFLFVAIWWLTAAGPGRPAAARAAAALVIGFLIAIVDGNLVGTEYLGAGAQAASPYHVDLNPISIAREWWRYAGEAGTVLWAYLAVLTIFLAVNRRLLALQNGFALIGLACAGLLTWAPNATLPNHHMAGYSWNGAYLLFTPVLLASPLWSAARRPLFVLLLVLGLLAPLGLTSAYAANKWIDDQQHRQRLVMTAVKVHMARLSPQTRRVLVSGLDFPFSPFDHPRSLFEYGAHLPTFSVVIYAPKDVSGIQRPSPVRWIDPKEAAREQFDEIWMFAEDGAAVDRTVSSSDTAALRSVGLNPSDLALYPEVFVALGVGAGPLKLDGYHLLNCGAAFLGYKQYDLALKCLSASEMQISHNPYPYFYSGLVDEQTHHLDRAKSEFARAMALDDPKTPNPAFGQALAGVQSAPSAPAS